jgi:lysophospholipase L1-like esterase
MLVLGDSIAWGMSASRSERAWASVAARQLKDLGSPRLKLINRGIPANVISPRNPNYKLSARPSLMERCGQTCTQVDPDLVVIAEGVNDLRAGMPSAEYAADLAAIVAEVRSRCRALVLLVGVYHQVHGRGMNDPRLQPEWSRWQPPDLVTFSSAARDVAERTGCVFVDALAVLGGADATLDADGCHLNDLGHRLVGNAVFRELAVRT